MECVGAWSFRNNTLSMGVAVECVGPSRKLVEIRFVITLCQWSGSGRSVFVPLESWLFRYNTLSGERVGPSRVSTTFRP